MTALDLIAMIDRLTEKGSGDPSRERAEQRRNLKRMIRRRLQRTVFPRKDER